MKKLAVLLMAFSGAAMVPGVALADTFTGVCTLAGVATLSPGIAPLPKQASFSFNTDGSSTNRCSGKLNGVTISNAGASAIATGSGSLSCAASNGKGTGTLTINGIGINFTLSIVGSGPQVALALTGTAAGNLTAKGNAVGQASFATDSTAAGQCAAKNATSLTFLIAATASKLSD